MFFPLLTSFLCQFGPDLPHWSINSVHYKYPNLLEACATPFKIEVKEEIIWGVEPLKAEKKLVKRWGNWCNRLGEIYASSVAQIWVASIHLLVYFYHTKVHWNEKWLEHHFCEHKHLSLDLTLEHLLPASWRVYSCVI